MAFIKTLCSGIKLQPDRSNAMWKQQFFHLIPDSVLACACKMKLAGCNFSVRYLVGVFNNSSKENLELYYIIQRYK
ncbi:hypothetical protein GLYMA_10G273400v4 [Glycine max]|uniref:Uncharacterized protein n=2 Tax=Glycine subgen. Soja TaxID=1462606 RepID=A0A0R0I980_SOYBN|nr:hypothetical protein JHK87_029302 [Glycine soja]KRH35940.1 hypothetical protein GLYMA_10G273400v4 [Glycine max]RZB89394.1 hypothetical protein D0Y65_028302 [Glycine soja]